MSTTAVFAELVVGGLQTMVWMTLLLVLVFGKPAAVPSLGSWPVDAGVVLAFAYAIGVVFDRLWDVLLDRTGVNRWIRGSAKSQALSPTDLLRRNVFRRDAAIAAEFVNYNRSRMRVARASMFNFLLLTIAGAALARRLDVADPAKTSAVVLIAGGLLTFVAGLAFWSLGKSYERCLRIVGVDEGDELRPLRD